MGKAPHDFDIATSARPEEVQALFPRTVPVGAQFGVVLVVEEGRDYQVATFRSDGAYLDGRHPRSVTFTTAEGDRKAPGLYDQWPLLRSDRRKSAGLRGRPQDLEMRTCARSEIPLIASPKISFAFSAAVRFASVLDFTIEAAPGMRSARASGHSRRQRRTYPRRTGQDFCLHRNGCADLTCSMPADSWRRSCRKSFRSKAASSRRIFIQKATSSSIRASCLPSCPSGSVPLVLAVLFHDLGKPPTMERDATGRIRFSGRMSR